MRVPSISSSMLPPVRPRVEIQGVRRTDISVMRISLACGASAGTAELECPDYPFAEDVLLDNDLVVISVEPYGVIFRGFISSSNPDSTGRVSFTALDYSEKLNDGFALRDYRYKDEVAKVRTNVCSVRFAAENMYRDYVLWQESLYTSPVLLSLDAESFPNVWTDELNVYGTPHGSAFAELLEKYSKSWTTTVEHTDAASYLRALDLTQGLRTVSLATATDPALGIADQPGGFASVRLANESIDLSQTYSHIYAEGAKAIIERSVALDVKGWVNQDPVDELFTINNYDLYSKREAKDYPNPNYDPRACKVYCSFPLPKVNDSWWYDFDVLKYGSAYSPPPDGVYTYGQRERYAKWESDLVQEIPNTVEAVDPSPFPTDPTEAGVTPEPNKYKPFIIAYRLDAPTDPLIITEGFSIDTERYAVTSDEPLVEDVRVINGISQYGSFTSYDSGTGRSVYSDLQYDFTVQLLAQGFTLANYATALNAYPWQQGKFYLYFGEVLWAYPVISWTDKTITVQGDLTGFGVAKADGSKAQGGDWQLISTFPRLAVGGSGAGYANGIYATGEVGIVPGQFTGKHLVLGDYTSVGGEVVCAGNPVVNTTGYTDYRIIGNDANGVIQIDAGTSLLGKSAGWQIVDDKISFKYPYTAIYLNAAYESMMPLSWKSAKLNSENLNRIAYVKDDDKKWMIQYNNWQIVWSVALNRWTASYHEGWTDSKKHITELENWGLTQHLGEYSARHEITCELPFFEMIRIGDRLILNGEDTGLCATRVDLDFSSASTSATFANRL